jgi:HSP20 family protein
MARSPFAGDPLKRLVFNGFITYRQMASRKLKLSGRRKQLNQIENMKLIQCERPVLAGLNFGRLSNLQDELDRLFESPLKGWSPALDVHEDKDSFVVRTELPGLKREDIEVSLHDGALIISGERKVEKVEEGVEVHRQERYFGKFQRALALPTPVAADKIKAQYKDGVLTVTLPKVEEAKPKQIDISVN